jgi:hypothetical protein
VVIIKPEKVTKNILLKMNLAMTWVYQDQNWMMNKKKLEMRMKRTTITVGGR